MDLLLPAVLHSSVGTAPVRTSQPAEHPNIEEQTWHNNSNRHDMGAWIHLKGFSCFKPKRYLN